MKVITNIITQAVFLTLFAGAALALAQEPATDELEKSISNISAQSQEERRAEIEQKVAERQAAVEAKKTEVQENVAERQAAIEEKRSEVQANIEERRAALQERAQERITNLAANISNRMDAVIERVQNIINRINSRIEKLTERGVDTAAAEAALASAQLSINAAVSEMNGIDADVAAAVSSEDVRASWEPVKERFTRVRNHLKTAHTELRATVAALKTAVAEAQSNNGVSDAVRNDTEVESEVETN